MVGLIWYNVPFASRCFEFGFIAIKTCRMACWQQSVMKSDNEQWGCGAQNDVFCGRRDRKSDDADENRRSSVAGNGNRRRASTRGRERLSLKKVENWVLVKSLQRTFQKCHKVLPWRKLSKERNFKKPWDHQEIYSSRWRNMSANRMRSACKVEGKSKAFEQRTLSSYRRHGGRTPKAYRHRQKGKKIN